MLYSITTKCDHRNLNTVYYMLQLAEKMEKKAKLDKDEFKLELDQTKEKFDFVSRKLKVCLYLGFVFCYF